MDRCPPGPTTVSAGSWVSGHDWAAYVTAFHARRPGITEQILTRTRDRAGHDPYDWLAGQAHTTQEVLDLACGNGALWPRLQLTRYLGLDASAAELAAATTRGAPRLVRAHAHRLPLSTASIDVVICSMALQILTPLPGVLTEVARVLRPRGRFAATMPAATGLRPGDLPPIVGLLTVLGRRLSYPNDPLMTRLPDLLAHAGLRLLCDRHRRFRYPMRQPADADRLLASLYLPDISDRRQRAARGYLRALAHVGVGLSIPIRCITAVRR